MSISPTPYSHNNRKYTELAHLCAQKEIYPLIFGEESSLLFLPLAPSQVRALDGNMAIDRQVKVRSEGLHESLPILVQERFRRPKYASLRDVTITEWNHSSNQRGELYKIRAELFLYGYYDDITDRFLEVIALDLFQLKWKIAKKDIPYTSEVNPRSNQTFYCFKFDDLHKHHITIFHEQWNHAA
jgi:hypothetical protein